MKSIQLLTLILSFFFFIFSPSPTLAASVTDDPSGTSCTDSLKSQISQFFDAGAEGYLLWQYSGNRKINPLENDPYSFFKDSPVCQAMSEIKNQFSGKFLGVNVHSLARYNEATIRDHLSYLSSSCGTSVVRIWGTPDRADPAKLKSFLDIATNYGIKVIIALADYSNSNGDILPASVHSNPASWYQDGYKQFYLPHVQAVVTTIGNHPSLFTYELANEPHCDGHSDCPPVYNQWVATVSSAIKSINPSARVSIGQMASQSTTLGDSPQNGDYQKSNSASNITLTSAHFYNDSERQSALMALSQANSLGKAFYIGEAPTSCLEIPSCELESTLLPPVNITDHLPATAPLPEPLNPLNKTPDYYPPAQDSQYITVCEFNQTIKESFDLSKDADGNYIPRTVSSIAEEIKDLKEYYSNFYRWLTVYLKPITNPFAGQEQIDNAFFSYSSVGYISSAYKMTPGDLQDEIKNDLISQARSGQVLNEQIAWYCPGQKNPCHTLNCGKPYDTCIPVYLADTSHQCHSLAFPYLNLTTAGSANSKVIIKNDDGQEKQVERMRPNGAIVFETQFANLAIPGDEQGKDKLVCKTVKRDETKDSTNPVTFNFFKKLADILNLLKPKTLTAKVKLEQLDDPRLAKGTQTMTDFFSFFIPADEQEKIKDKDKSSTGDKVNLPDYGNDDLQDTFTKMLQPADWQTGSL